MFVFDRSAAAVLVPIALLVAVVLWSAHTPDNGLEAARTVPSDQASTVAKLDVRQPQGG